MTQPSAQRRGKDRIKKLIALSRLPAVLGRLRRIKRLQMAVLLFAENRESTMAQWRPRPMHKSFLHLSTSWAARTLLSACLPVPQPGPSLALSPTPAHCSQAAVRVLCTLRVDPGHC